VIDGIYLKYVWKLPNAYKFEAAMTVIGDADE
jgi:hypothetical protein